VGGTVPCPPADLEKELIMLINQYLTHDLDPRYTRIAFLLERLDAMETIAEHLRFIGDQWQNVPRSEWPDHQQREWEHWSHLLDHFYGVAMPPHRKSALPKNDGFTLEYIAELRAKYPERYKQGEDQDQKQS
jgi:hypothetical protein